MDSRISNSWKQLKNALGTALVTTILGTSGIAHAQSVPVQGTEAIMVTSIITMISDLTYFRHQNLMEALMHLCNRNFDGM